MDVFCSVVSGTKNRFAVERTVSIRVAGRKTGVKEERPAQERPKDWVRPANLRFFQHISLVKRLSDSKIADLTPIFT